MLKVDHGKTITTAAVQLQSSQIGYHIGGIFREVIPFRMGKIKAEIRIIPAAGVI